jgi:hypothetical protein
VATVALRPTPPPPPAAQGDDNFTWNLILSLLGQKCGTNLQERVTVVIGEATPHVPDHDGWFLPAEPPPIGEEIDTSTTPADFLRDTNREFGGLFDEFPDIDAAISDMLAALDGLGSLLDGLDLSIAEFGGITDFLSNPTPPEVTGAFADALTGGQAALDAGNAALTAYAAPTQPTVTAPPPPTGTPTGSGPGGGVYVVGVGGGGGGGSVSCEADTNGILCLMFMG